MSRKKIQGEKAYQLNMERGILVSSEDESLLIDYLWCLHPSGYAFNNKIREEYESNMLNRVVWERMGKDLSLKVIHRNEDKKDCRRENLMGMTHAEVEMSRKDVRSNTGHKNISLTKSGKYRVRIQRKKDRIEGGVFTTLEEAIAKAEELDKVSYSDK